tara:strand:+ start:208 stop:537 length:330 start_codon:yes stop_codon:yes gene_type:complete
VTEENGMKSQSRRRNSKPRWSFYPLLLSISQTLRKLFMKQTIRSKIVLENEEILLHMLSSLVKSQKDSLVSVVEISKIQGDMAVSLRDVSNALQEIAWKLPHIDGKEIN